MKIEINKKENKEKFPCIMKSNHGSIVLFTEECSGVVLSGSIYNKVGDYHGNWDMLNFIPFEGSITLSND
jgi:hypothetical protein